MSRQKKRPYLSSLFLSQHCLDILDYKTSYSFLEEALSDLPSQHSSVIERGHNLMEILKIVNGYYFTLSDERRRKIITEQFYILLEGAYASSQLVRIAMSNYKEELDIEIHRLSNIKSLDNIFNFQIADPTYDHFCQWISSELTPANYGRDFTLLFECFYNRKPWKDFVKILPLNRVETLPCLTGESNHNLLGYEFSKLLYLLYMQIGFTPETCTALFLHDMSFLNKLSIFSIFGEVDFGPATISDKLSKYFQFNTKNVVVEAFNKSNIGTIERVIIETYLGYYSDTFDQEAGIWIKPYLKNTAKVTSLP
jgi:hypothetical protein